MEINIRRQKKERHVIKTRETTRGAPPDNGARLFRKHRHNILEYYYECIENITYFVVIGECELSEPT